MTKCKIVEVGSSGKKQDGIVMELDEGMGLSTPRKVKGTCNKMSISQGAGVKKMELTKEQQRIMKGWEKMGAGGMKLEFIPEFIRLMAYYRAGQVAARMFTGRPGICLGRVSIIPDEKHQQMKVVERELELIQLFNHPIPELQRCEGILFLLRRMAGKGATYRMRLLNKMPLTHKTPNLSCRDNPELLEPWVSEVAGLVAAPNHSENSALDQAEKWTLEMLEEPVVWRTVEKLAGMLLKQTTIESADTIMSACSEIIHLGIRLPKWNRRLVPNDSVLLDMVDFVDEMELSPMD